MRRQAFDDIASGWMLVHDVGALTDKIEELAAWTEANGPLTDDEMATVKLMIECQIAWELEEDGGLGAFLAQHGDTRIEV